MIATFVSKLFLSFSDASLTITDHIYIDQKLTDIGWPTEIVLPSIFAYRH